MVFAGGFDTRTTAVVAQVVMSDAHLFYSFSCVVGGVALKGFVKAWFGLL